MPNVGLKIADRIQRKLKANYLQANKHKLKVKDFTVVCNNCWGGILYQDLGLPYQTPFVNMFMFADCYLKLVKNFKTFMRVDLVISSASRYLDTPARYPVGHLNDVEIHFIHYTFNDSILEMWQRRCARINYERLIFVMSERDGCTPQHIEDFKSQDFAKLVFTRFKYSGKDVYRIFPFLTKEVLPADVLMGFSYRAVNPVKWINQKFNHS